MSEKGQYIIHGIRGVCGVIDVAVISRPDGSRGKFYYVLKPYYHQDSEIVTPMDSDRTIVEPLFTREEALELTDRIQDVQEMEVTENKQREERYKEALETCDCRTWVSMIKASHLHRKGRIEQGEKMTNLDERYLKTAEEDLYSGLALFLGMSWDEMVGCIKGRVLVGTPAVGRRKQGAARLSSGR